MAGKLTNWMSGYWCWYSMVSRCTKPSYTGWDKYGGAGISVEPSWIGADGLAAFTAHIGPRPSSLHQIDRIDGTKGYSIGNVRWATPTEQNRNRKDNVVLTLNDESLPMSEWAERLGITRQSMHKRLARWPLEKALTGNRRKYPPRTALKDSANG